VTLEPLRTIVAADAEDLARQAADLVLSLIQRALKERGRARVILTGGATPRRAYGLLAEGILAARVEVERVEWFFGDERWVGRDDPQSNEGMALASLLRPIRAPEATVRSWRAGTGDPVDCARRYDAMVRQAMAGARNAPDVLLLGIGADGHTASLFHGAVAHLPDGRQILITPDIHGAGGQSQSRSPSLDRAVPGRVDAAAANGRAAPGRTSPHGPPMRSAAAAVEGGAARGWRLTLCPDFLRTSRCVVFLAAGREKADALARALSGDPATPASWIRGGTTIFMATRDAMGPEAPDFAGWITHA
jgi:6-phosphogluconolactonase/glucosamine-6-phosphate isomerase/deaminase